MKLEHRLHPRCDASEQVSFMVPMLEFQEIKYVNGDGVIVNRSRGGICIKTGTHLETGHVLRIDNYIGLVKWVRNIDNDGYTAGILCV